MKICAENKNDPDLRYYLSDNRKFRSVVELVAWYSLHSLRESFSGLDTRLRFSVGELTLVEAQYEFAPALSDKNMLSLLPGDRLVVLDKNYWKSQLPGMVESLQEQPHWVHPQGLCKNH